MRAQVMTQPDTDPHRALRLTEVPIPIPGPGQVRLRVEASAVCRTDLQLTTGELAPHKLPIVPGHQVVGRVEALGPGVSGLEAGDRVGLVWLASACGTCRFCRTGRENLCLNARFTGWDVDGGYAERVVAEAAFCHPIAAEHVAAAVAPLLCGGVIGYRSLGVAGVGPHSAGSTLGLFGFGASALLAIQVARHWGVRTFVVTRSRSEMRRALVEGAEWAGTYDDQVPVRLEAAITFAPVGWVVGAAVRSLDRGGTVAINAIHLDEVPAMDYDDLWWERSIRSVANVTRDDVKGFLDVVARAGVRTQYEELPLARAAEGLVRLRDGDVAGTFVLLPA